MIQRDYNTVDQCVWDQLRCCPELQWLTLEHAKQVVDFTAQLIRWREQEIDEQLRASSPVNDLQAFRERTVEHLIQHKVPAPADIVAVDREVKAVHALPELLYHDENGKPVHACAERCPEYPICECGPL